MRNLGFLLFLAPFFCAAQSKVNYKAKGAPMPSFVLEQPNGQLYKSSALQKGKPVLLLIFSPQCDHCANKLDTIKTMAAAFRNTQLVMLTEARNKPYLKDFLKKKGYDKVPLFRNLGCDGGTLVADIYAYGMLPQYSFYNAQHKFIKSFSGNFPIDSLRMMLR